MQGRSAFTLLGGGPTYLQPPGSNVWADLHTHKWACMHARTHTAKVLEYPPDKAGTILDWRAWSSIIGEVYRAIGADKGLVKGWRSPLHSSFLVSLHSLPRDQEAGKMHVFGTLGQGYWRSLDNTMRNKHTFFVPQWTFVCINRSGSGTPRTSTANSTPTTPSRPGRRYAYRIQQQILEKQPGISHQCPHPIHSASNLTEFAAISNHPPKQLMCMQNKSSDARAHSISWSDYLTSRAPIPTEQREVLEICP